MKSRKCSSNALEDTLTEFKVQGLEIDWACVAWGADLRLNKDHTKWEHFQLRSGTKYLGTSAIFTLDICKPYFHMQHESFWRLGENNEVVRGMTAEPNLWVQAKKEQKYLPKGSYSILIAALPLLALVA
mgnify:CR=1 FL=1